MKANELRARDEGMRVEFVVEIFKYVQRCYANQLRGVSQETMNRYTTLNMLLADWLLISVFTKLIIHIIHLLHSKGSDQKACFKCLLCIKLVPKRMMLLSSNYKFTPLLLFPNS